MSKFSSIILGQWNQIERKRSRFQFVFRATNVVQLRIAAVTSDKSAEVCADNRLQLLDAPLIYYGTPHFWKEDRNQDAQYNECPLKGKLRPQIRDNFDDF